MTGMWPAITAIVTLILGPLLGIWIKNYFSRKAAAEAAAKAEADAELAAKQNQGSQAGQAQDVNTSIDAQQKASQTPIKP